MSEYTTLTAEMSQSNDGKEGELIIDTEMLESFNYDIDDLGDGRIVIQYWEE